MPRAYDDDQAMPSFDAALNALHQARIDEIEEHDPHFVRRVVRRVETDQSTNRLRYWAPVLLGAGLAAGLLLAVVTAISEVRHEPVNQPHVGTALHRTSADLPNLQWKANPPAR